MKKLKEKLINRFSILFLVPIIFLHCKSNSSKSAKSQIRNVVVEQIPLRKDDFFKCTGAKDSVFANGDYVKFINSNDESYTIAVEINGVLDTLDFYFNCKTNKGMIPKVLVKSDLGFICLAQGSTSYRYLTLCDFDKNTKTVKVSKFETTRDVSSEIDGFIFNRGTDLFFYSIDYQKLFVKKLVGNSIVIKEAILSGRDEISVINDKNDTVIYNVREFQ